MSNEHKSETEILAEIEAAKAKITVGGRYAHYKDRQKTYLVQGLATIESTNELAVIYQAEYGQKLTFVRPLSVWLEKVQWRGKNLPRFTKL